VRSEQVKSNCPHPHDFCVSDPLYVFVEAVLATHIVRVEFGSGDGIIETAIKKNFMQNANIFISANDETRWQ